MKQLLVIFFILIGGMANAQIATTIHSGQDLFQRNLYSADKVMEMREELELTDAQVANIKKAYSKNAGEFSTVKWDLDEASVKLKNLINLPKIDQVAVQKQMDAVLKLENQLKKMQLDNLVAIKNELTEEQQKKLQSSPNVVLGRVSSVQSTSGVQGIKFGQSGISQTKVIGYPAATSVSGVSSVGPGVSVYVAGSDQNGTPLYYIDSKSGMKQVTTFDDIDPKDIQSMEVLKGEKAIEKFGQKAKNGVIIIKMKEDKSK